MQISRSADADWPTSRPTWLLRCFGCSPTRPAFSCCGRSLTASCQSTTWPDGWASRRRRCHSTWPSCEWRGWCAPGVRAPRCSTDWKRPRPPARHRRGVQRRACRRRRARPPPRQRRAAAAARKGDGLMGIAHSHDHTDSVDNALRDSAAGIRTVKISLVVLGITAAAQLVIVVLSGSVALFADTVHNFSDALTAVPLWIAFSISRRAATRRYTYGFGRVEDLAGLFVVAMIAISAVVAAVEAVRRLVDPVPLTHLSWVAAAGVVGFLGNEVVALYRIRVGKRIGSAALEADGMHARADGLTSLAVVAGAVGAPLGLPAADPIVGLLIAAAIAVVLIFAARDVFGRLLDRVDPDLVDSAAMVLAARPGARAVRRVRMRWVGHQLEADAELDIDPSLSLADAHTVAHGAEHELAHAIPKLGSVIVHAYPAHESVLSS